MNDKDSLADGVHLVMEEAWFDCAMTRDREKDNEETSSVLFGFSKYIEGLNDFIDNDDFEEFIENIFTVVKNYLIGKKDYKSTIKEMTQYETAFSKEFLK